MKTYRNEFDQAVLHSKALGFPSQTFGAQTSNCLTHDDGVKMVELLREKLADLGGLQPTRLAFQCGQVSVAMVRHLKEVAGVNAVLTLGTAMKSGVLLWNPDVTRLAQSIEDGDYHVWLTTPAFEIVDFTIDVSIRHQQGRDQSHATPVAGLPDHLHPYSWHPLVAGEEAVRTLLRIP